MTYRIHGIVLGKRDFRESDRIYTIYTAEHGKIEALGQATRKITSKLASHLEPPAMIDALVARGRILDRIAGAKRLIAYEHIRKDYSRANAFLRIADFFEKEVKLGQKDGHLFMLLRDSLDNLAASHVSPEKPFFGTHTLPLTDYVQYGIIA